MTLHHPCNRPCWRTKSSDEAITFSINSCNIFEKRPAPQRFTQAHWQDMMRKIKHETKPYWSKPGITTTADAVATLLG
ncbi:hypothetical protein DPMN_053908 [Dreissena polymorpha]|uniref:Uncharacterized protein n=1 Tax=Dreissena polymorpha TaxID=45954 RepID=A0A9D4HP97_DREPO|nr:hypothetical protein DPMN_053908 [Dreissena polymorpha]